MRIPVPTNKIVIFTLVGALLTTLAAGGLAAPSALNGALPGGIAESSLLTQGGSENAGSSAAQPTAAPQTPEPKENFTPAVETRVASQQDSSTPLTPTPTAVAQTPTPNPNFTPAVQNKPSSEYQDHDDEEDEEDEEDEYDRAGDHDEEDEEDDE